jgi:hypothetical protein
MPYGLQVPVAILLASGGQSCSPLAFNDALFILEKKPATGRARDSDYKHKLYK